MTQRLQKGLDKAKQLGASAAKIVFYHQEKTDCQFEAGRLKDTGEQESISFSVEVLVGRRKGRTSGNRRGDFDTLIEQAVTLAKVGGSVAHFDAYPAPSEAPVVKTYSNKTIALSREKMIEACQHMADTLKTYNPALFIECSASRTESESLLLTTGGVLHPFKRTHWRLSAFVQRTADTDLLFAGHGRAWCDLANFYDPAAIAERIIADLHRAETIAPPPSGKVKAYIPPETLPRLLWPLFMGTNGRNVAKGDSPLAGRLGERVLASSLTITDDPHQDYASGARGLDNNGVPTRKQTLFNKGVLNRFLYDLDSAGLTGTNPTGNNRCQPHSPRVSPGGRQSVELLAEIDDGLYIQDLIGFGQSNIINGDFSCNLGLGYRVRHGEVVGRVKNTMIAGNLYQILKHNVLVSRDMDYQQRYPHMVVEGMSVVGNQ
jgi:PmbA protein